MTQELLAREVEEGNEIMVRPGEYAIVEDVQTKWAGIGSQERTTILLIDGREFTVSADRAVVVVS